MSPPTVTRILVVDDEPNQLTTISRILSRQGHEVATAANGADALEVLARDAIDVLITDLNMPVMDGMTLLREVADLTARPSTVVLTGYGTIQSAVDAMKHGAADYLIKPCNPDELKLVIERQLEMRALRREVSDLRREVKRHQRYGALVGNSAPMRAVYDVIESVSQNKSTVLITGASGTGKELVARTLHARSPWSAGPFIAVNCGAVSETLLDSQLFGHRRGAFTDAVGDQEGLFQAAHRGTLFLDEVSEIPLALQVKFLRAVQEREVLPVGATRPKKVDVRIVAATNKDLREEMNQRRFREDLFYRLNVVTLRLPSLAERPEDVEPLTEHFIEEMAASYGVGPKTLTPAARARLVSYAWPGNARELQNVIERAFALSDATEIDLSDVNPALAPMTDGGDAPGGQVPSPRIQTLEEAERELIVAALHDSAGNKNEAARLLGIDRQRLYRKIARYQLK
ncbi:MAG: sigma-54 dependent transcriptional regulator [Candidatus Binatia bacterium]|nr:sigma-54 dependent transcriptional regulator [Candidatus Binatia bacterium]